MSVNVDKLLEELRFLTIHPEKWDQTRWAQVEGKEPPRETACGSFGCLAGNTVIHEGLKLDWYSEEIPQYHLDGSTTEYITRWFADRVFTGRTDPHYGGPETREIHAQARDDLGLTEYQADRLFHEGNTEEKLWSLAQDLTLGEISQIDYSEALAERDRVKVSGETHPLST
jgi:hypothetical protein